MRLSEEEYYEFLDIHQSMLLFAGQKQGLLDSEMDLDEFRLSSGKEKLTSREALYQTPGIIDEYVEANPFDLSEEELAIALGFKDFLAGTFYVVKYLKKHTIFLKDDVAYGVLSLSDPLQDILGNMSPVYVQAVLLPYRGKIVYDGIIISSSIYFGGGIRTSINQDYNEAKANYGIVTELPFVKPKKTKQAPEDKLAFYMRNAKNREYYAYEIDDFLEKHPDLIGKYYWHWGRINSRKKKKWLKELGIYDLHFAIVDDTIIAQGESARQVKEMVKAMLPKDKWDWAFYFKVK
jgi:hypothetical protein